MFDYINTKYEDAEIIIDVNTAKTALKIIKEKIKNEGETAELYCYLSKAYIYLEKHKKALEFAQKAKELDSDYLYADARLVMAYSKLEEDKEVFKITNELYENSKLDIATAYICFISLLSINSGNDRCIKWAEKLSKKIPIPKNSIEYSAKIQALLFSKHFISAERLIKEAQQKNCMSLDLYHTISFVYYNYNKHQKSLKYIEKAIELDSNDSYNYYRKGWSLYKLEKWEEALEAFKLAEKFKCKFKDIYTGMARIYLEKDDYKNALKYTQKIKKDANPYFLRGLFYYDNDKNEEALQDFLKAESVGYQNSNMYAYISYIMTCKKEYNKALEYANKAILLDNNNAFAHYRRGWILFILCKNDKAKQSFLKAEELGCIYSDMYSKLACLFYMDKEYKEALVSINKALLLCKDSPYYYYQKAEILSVLGDTDAAEKCCQKAELLE